MSSNSPKIKVCGMRDLENIEAVNAVGVDFMGFIFFKGSKRFVGNNFVLPQNFLPQTKRVGVFVNERVDEIQRLANKHQLQYVQLHGNESIETCSALKSIGLKIIKAFVVGENFNCDNIKEFEEVADYFLFDAKGTERGGNGIAFDWNILSNCIFRVPYFLSGGISLSNIKMVRNVIPSPFAIDINSGVEAKVGLKDIQKISQIKLLLTKQIED